MLFPNLVCGRSYYQAFLSAGPPLATGPECTYALKIYLFYGGPRSVGLHGVAK
jgi:hypothetical protein